MSFTCDGCDAEISEEHTPVQILRRYPHKDLDLHLCTRCYRGAKEFTTFWKFIVIKQYLKERTKDMNLKPRKDWRSGLTNEELQLQQQEEQLN